MNITEDDVDAGLRRSRERGLRKGRNNSDAVPVEAPPDGPDLVRLDKAERTEVAWLWPGRIPLGKITVLAGDPGLGKSFITLDIAARVSTGAPWPDDLDTPQPARSVVLLSAEDDIGDTILPRLEGARANLKRIAALRGIRKPTGSVPFCLDRDLPNLERAVAQGPDVGLVIVDPITAYVGGVDMNSNPEVRGLLAPLADLAMRRSVAIVLVTHLNKGNGGGKGIYRISGSLALPAAARAAMLAVKDADNPERRLLLPTKMNVGRAAQGLAYRIAAGAQGGEPVVQWEDGPVVISADEAVRAEEAPAEQGGAIEEAAAFLRELLKDGPVAATQVQEEAGPLGISEHAIKRARARIGVVSRRAGQKWVLTLT